MVITGIFVIQDHEISIVREAENLGACWNLGALGPTFSHRMRTLLSGGKEPSFKEEVTRDGVGKMP